MPIGLPSFGFPVISALHTNEQTPIDMMPSNSDSNLTTLRDYFQEVQGYNSAEAIASFNRSQEAVKQQQDWYKMMSDTEIQRRMQDLKAAGVNPVLAVGSLGGASSQMSGQAQSSAASSSVPNNANTLAGLLSSSASVVSAIGAVVKAVSAFLV